MGEENALFLHLLGPLTIPDATYLSFTASICSHLTVRLLRILDPNHVHEELARALVSGRVRSPRGKRSIWRLSYKEGKRRKEEEEEGEWHTCLCRCRAGRSECGSSFRQRIYNCEECRSVGRNSEDDGEMCWSVGRPTN